MKSRTQFYLGLLAFFLTASTFYLGQISNQYWFFVWLFPIPILLYSYNTTRQNTVIVSFFSLLLPTLAVLITEYGSSALPTPMEVIPSLLHSLIFTALIVLNRYCIQRQPFWLTPWILPSILSLYQFSWSFSQLSSFLHFGISNQINFLPTLQIVSVFGPVSLSFLMHFFATSLASALYFRHKPAKYSTLLLVLGIILGSTLIYGQYRLTHIPQTTHTRIALGGTTPKTNLTQNSANPQFDQQRIGGAPALIQALAATHPDFIVTPEMWLRLSDDNRQAALQSMQSLAKQFNANLIIGIKSLSHTQAQRNAAWIINQQGSFIGQYNKIHLIPVTENYLTPGKKAQTFDLSGVRFGIEIGTDALARDLTIRYSQQGAQLVLIMDVSNTFKGGAGDADENRRMAILRSVSGGFALARIASYGQLTLADAYGHIVANAHTPKNPATITTVSATVPLGNGRSFYSKHPNLSGYLSLFITLLISLRLMIQSAWLRKIRQ